MNKCLICKSQLKSFNEIAQKDQFLLECPRCGRFYITGTLKGMLEARIAEDDDWRWILSYWIRNRQDREESIILGAKDFKTIPQEINLPSLNEQSDNLILYLGKELKHPASKIETISKYLASVIGAKFPSDVDFISEHLHEKGYLNFYRRRDSIEDGPMRDFGLTFNGWGRYDEILRSGSESKLAFMAMEYDEELIEIYKEYFTPAVAQTGYELKIVRDVLKAGLIDNQMRIEIRKSRFLLADLSHDNNGAYWEAGYAEGLGRPVIYLCEKEKFETSKSHFDTNHHTTIVWDKENIKTSMEELKATIRATFPAEAKMSDD